MPEFSITTSTILPFLITGLTWAPYPNPNLISGGLSKFMTSDDPYPTPPFDKYNDVTSPRKIGSILASKVSLPIEDIPTFPTKFTEISW